MQGRQAVSLGTLPRYPPTRPPARPVLPCGAAVGVPQEAEVLEAKRKGEYESGIVRPCGEIKLSKQEVRVPTCCYLSTCACTSVNSQWRWQQTAIRTVLWLSWVAG